MRCFFVIPAWAPEEIFSRKTAGAQINYWQPLGTLYVAAAVRAAGHQVRLLNGAFESQEAMLAAIRAGRPQVVGIYSTTFGWPKAKETARAVKAIDPAIHVTVGGPYPVAREGACLDDCPFVDTVVTGEGELTMPELLERLASGQSLAGCLGVAFRENGQVQTNPPRPFITDLDALPLPARDLLGGVDAYVPPPATYRRKPVAVMITARGCNRRCLFCFQLDKSRKSGVRFRSVDSVLAEIEHLLAAGYREIKFIDDTLAADYHRAMTIANEIQARGLDFTWFASACVSQVDEALFRAFKAAGCWAVLLGAESGVQKSLNAIRKGITLEQTRRAVKAAKRAGLVVYTPFLFGIPGETFADGLATIDFACQLDPDIANFHALTPFPGTELYDNLPLYGTMSEDLADYTYQGAAFVPHSMSRDEIQKLRQLALRRFYSRPSFLLRRLLALRNRHDLHVALKGAKSLFWLWAQRDLFSRPSR
ncbi:MAG: radical SAM protein [Thermodesulfobacteriota bacterium]